MSGLFVRSLLIAGQDGIRDLSSKRACDLVGRAVRRSISGLGSP